MGYGLTTTAVLGVMLSEHDAAKLAAHIEALPRGDAPSYWGNMDAAMAQLQKPLKANGLKMDFISDGTDDPTSDSGYFNPGYDHAFGLVLAEKGYGASGDSSSFASKTSSPDIVSLMEAFDEHLVPLLGAAGLPPDSPAIQVVSRMR